MLDNKIQTLALNLLNNGFSTDTKCNFKHNAGASSRV